MNEFLRMKINLYKNPVFILLLLIIVYSCSEANEKPKTTPKELISNKISHLYQTKSIEELQAPTYEEAFDLYTEEELETLATGHWTFKVNVPVVVSLMRSKKQERQPFWLQESGFVKTDMELRNEMTDYEVWQKKFDKGEIGLGINGLENYSYHYFVSVAPQNESEEVIISDLYPETDFVGTMDDGAFVYHDWDELVLFDVPNALKGHQLLTTVRGRGTETQLVNAFRTTKFPSSEKADQIMLTWSDDPSSTMDIQWRTAKSIDTSAVTFRIKGTNDSLSLNASKYEMEDLRLANDRFVHRFTAKLKDLEAGTTYEYKISTQDHWPETQTFTTQSNNGAFSFIWYGDSHFSPIWGNLANQAFQKHPDAAFHAIAGDLVSDGLHRDQWDELFEYSKDVISQRPFMNVLGNHDNRMGLGAEMYRELFSYPPNGPKDIPNEHTYAFNYKNGLFLMIDATSKDELQTQWIEQKLSESKATWKFAMFHFPPYNWEEPYPNIQKEWIPLFDKYHVDMVFSGHIHYYMRSNPMKDGKVVPEAKDGTTYMISIGIPSGPKDIGEEPYAAVRYDQGPFYQVLEIDGNTLNYTAKDSSENVIDELRLVK